MGMVDWRTVYEHAKGEWRQDGSGSGQTVQVQEYWQTIGGNGKPYCSKATREDAIYEHLHTNAFLSSQRAEIKKEFGRDSNVIGEPLCGVQHVVRYETTSVWAEADPVEPIDVLNEIANEPPCPHPPEQVMAGNAGYGTNSYRFCGRCCERLPDEPGAPA